MYEIVIVLIILSADSIFGSSIVRVQVKYAIIKRDRDEDAARLTHCNDRADSPYKFYTSRACIYFERRGGEVRVRCGVGVGR